jgi:hypothetical protein
VIFLRGYNGFVIYPKFVNFPFWYHAKKGSLRILDKLRRSTGYDGFDLRQVEDPIKKAFGGCYMGGGGHSGAASFRVASHDEKEFFLRFQLVADFIKSSVK